MFSFSHWNLYEINIIRVSGMKGFFHLAKRKIKATRFRLKHLKIIELIKQFESMR